MYTITTNNSLAVILEGVEQMLSFKAKILVERSNIKSIKWHDSFNDWSSLQVRMPGSYLPSWIMAGSYWNEDGWDFIYAKKPKGMTRPTLFNVLVIETNKPKYRRIIVGLGKDKASDVIAWWSRK